MSCYSIVYRDGRKYAVPVNSREEYLAIRDNAQNLANLSLARGGDKVAKSRLAQFNYSLAMPNRPTPAPSHRGRGIDSISNDWGFPLKNADGIGNSVGMDVDHIDDVQAVADRVLSMKDDIGLLMLERSASGNGLHLVFRRNASLSQEENIRKVAEEIGIEPDMGAKDITRVFFASSGSKTDLIYLDDELFRPTPCPRHILGDTQSPTSHKGRGIDSNVPPQAADGEGSNAEGSQREKVTNPLPIQREGVGGGSYMGVPYSVIIDKYWEIHHGGRTPVVSNRDTLTYELAVNLRHICGFDENLMDRVIPCYDGFPQDQKMKCIRSAIEAKRTQMPRKLREVLEAISASNFDNEEVLEAVDKIRDEDDAMYGKMLPELPMGIRDCVEVNGDALAMPSLLVSCACIGALATNVKLKVHNKARGLNIYPFVCGEFASGKGQMDQIYEAWTRQMQRDADEYYVREQEWAVKAQAKKSGTTEKAPQFPVRMLPLNNTLANISERLGNTKGRHAISFTPEADMVFSKWKGCITDFSVMIRIAYDESRYDREAKSAEAVRVHIPNLLWNVIMCGTQDSLYRLVSNMTDGFLSRLCICKTPDNTWERYQERDTNLSGSQRFNIEAMTKMLTLAEGTMEGEELEQFGLQWLEEIRLTAIKSYDKVLARQRFRGCVNAQRVVGAILLCKCMEQLYKDCNENIDSAISKLHRNPQCWMMYIDKCFEGDDMKTTFQVVSDALMDVSLYFFRDKLAEAYADKQYAKATSGLISRHSENNSIFDNLPVDFSFEQAMSEAIEVKGINVSNNTIKQMLKNWKKQNLITAIQDQKFKKWGA